MAGRLSPSRDLPLERVWTRDAGAVMGIRWEVTGKKKKAGPPFSLLSEMEAGLWEGLYGSGYFVIWLARRNYENSAGV